MDASLPDALPVAAPPETGRADQPLPGTRAWFVFFVLWMAGWAGLALLFLARAEQGDTLAMRIWLLSLMCFYLSLCNIFLPLPTAWIVFLAALPDYALVQTPWLRVPLTAAVLASATVVANLNEYHVLAYLLHSRLGQRIRRAKTYGWAARWFGRSPFELLALVAFIPIPVDAVRWLAILERYSRLRFALAYFTGRGLRYVLFAACSMIFAFTPTQILLIQIALVAAALGGRGIAAAVRRARRSAAPAAS